jgi:hypothetical protein
VGGLARRESCAGGVVAGGGGDLPGGSLVRRRYLWVSLCFLAIAFARLLYGNGIVG